MSFSTNQEIVRKNGEIVTKALRYFLGEPTNLGDIVRYIAATEKRNPLEIADCVFEVLENGVHNGFICKTGNLYYYDMQIPMLQRASRQEMQSPMQVRSLEMITSSSYSQDYQPNNAGRRFFEHEDAGMTFNPNMASTSYHDPFTNFKGRQRQSTPVRKKRQQNKVSYESVSTNKKSAPANPASVQTNKNNRFSAAKIDEIEMKYVRAKPKSKPRKNLNSRSKKSKKVQNISPTDRVLRSQVQRNSEESNDQ